MRGVAILWYAAILAGVSGAPPNQFPEARLHLHGVLREKVTGFGLDHGDQVKGFHKILDTASSAGVSVRSLALRRSCAMRALSSESACSLRTAFATSGVKTSVSGSNKRSS
jgi:hypothetical protein